MTDNTENVTEINQPAETAQEKTLKKITKNHRFDAIISTPIR